MGEIKNQPGDIVHLIKYDIKELISHETKKHVSIRFLLALFIFLSYLLFVTYRFGLKDGILVSFLTWSFFVFCTPIADAGLLLDFPLRLVIGIRMIYSEVLVWITALSLNLYAYFFNPSIYKKTILLHMFYEILTHPYPLWVIIILSGIGTFMSIYFGDELLDVIFHHQREKYQKHHMKLKFIIYLTLILIVVFFYNYLVKFYGIHFV